MQYKDIFETVTYTTSAGDTVVLSAEGNDKWWETRGREGFSAPDIKTESRTYANGSSRTLAAVLQSRKVKLQMVVSGKSAVEMDSIYFDLVSRLMQVGSQDEWGRLNLRRSDGKWVYLNCLYTGGFPVKEQYPRHQQFTLSFEAGDPYFYSERETVLMSEQLTQQVYLSDQLFLGDDLFLNDGLTDIEIGNKGEICYPVIEVTGPASVIRVTNLSTGKTLSMAPDFSLLAGQKLTLDCRENLRKITMTQGGAVTDISHRLALGSSLVFPLRKGDNRLKLYYTDSSEASGYRISYQERYYSA